MARSSFGRRAHAASPAPAQPPVMRKFSHAGDAPGRTAPDETKSPDEELNAWKKARGVSPYVRPVALMASLSFGVASLALPAVVNDWVQYPLYALSAASLYVGFRRKRS